MDLLHSAADIFKGLLKKEYIIVVGKNKKLTSYNLTFSIDDFKHIVGLHKLKDMTDISEASSRKLYDNIIKCRIGLSDISNSEYFPEILNRISNLIYLEDYLDRAQIIYFWDKNKSSFSSIDANIMIPFPSTPFCGETAYIFFKSYDERKLKIEDFFTDSVIKENPVSLFSSKRDYTKGQVRPPLLMYKEKIDYDNNVSIILHDKLSMSETENEKDTAATLSKCHQIEEWGSKLEQKVEQEHGIKKGVPETNHGV